MSRPGLRHFSGKSDNRGGTSASKGGFPDKFIAKNYRPISSINCASTAINPDEISGLADSLDRRCPLREARDHDYRFAFPVRSTRQNVVGHGFRGARVGTVQQGRFISNGPDRGNETLHGRLQQRISIIRQFLSTKCRRSCCSFSHVLRVRFRQCALPRRIMADGSGLRIVLYGGLIIEDVAIR